MSTAMLTTVSFNFYMLSGSAPIAPSHGSTATPDRAAGALGQADDEHKRFRENTLVSSIMAAFQALGIGRPAAGTPSGSATTPASSSTTPSAGDATAGTPGTGTDATPAPDTLEKAVNAFAHTLSQVLHQQSRSGHADTDQGGAQVPHHEGRGRAGYRSLVQGLEQLAQSLGAAPTPTPSTASTATPVTVPGAALPAFDTSRLLDTFTRVLSFLQTPSTTTDAGTGTLAGSVATAADKLKQFISTLVQSLHAGGFASPPSPLGSRLNLTA